MLTAECLNPFFIRSVIQMKARTHIQRAMGLNPFFIRSVIQMNP